MTELLRTNDLIFLTFLEALLKSAGIAPVVFDEGMNALDGNIGAFPKRLMVESGDADAARRIIDEAGYGESLSKTRS